MSAINHFKRFCFNNKEFKAEYLAKSPLEKWLFIRKINIFLLQFIGAQFMEANYKLHFKTLIPLYLMLNYLSLLIYTLFYYRHTPFRAFQSTPMCEIIIPVKSVQIFIQFITYCQELSILVPNFIHYRFAAIKKTGLYNFAGDFIYANSGTSSKNHRVWDRMAIYLLSGSIKISLLMLFSVSLCVFPPLYKKNFTDDNEMIISVILPFIDPDTKTGFYINLANQMVTCVYGAVIIPATELITCVLKKTASATAAIIENSLQEFGDSLQHTAIFSNKHALQFHNLILKMIDFDKFVSALA